MSLAVAILAAGLGTRMKSQTPKVLHTILGKPMIQHVIDTVLKVKPRHTVVVTNRLQKEVTEYLSHTSLEAVFQQRPLGTADAVKTAYAKLGNFQGTVLVVNGDTPLITAGTLKKFLSRHKTLKSDLSVLSFFVDAPYSYGRILRDTGNKAYKIVEEKDLAGNQKKIQEVNSGVYAIERKAGSLLKKIKMNHRKKEYYLTDLLELGVSNGLTCNVVPYGNEEEFYGVNTMIDLFNTQRILQRRVVDRFMKRGVKFYDPDSVVVHPEARIASDAVIYPCVWIEGRTRIGRSTTIYGGVRIIDSIIGKGVTILDHSLIEMSKIDAYSVVGPFAHLRPESVIGKRVRIGNFVEVKNSDILDDTKAAHLSYIGDASVGRDVNIGAGTITCNYDGLRKQRTVIENGAFIGSDSQLVAPVRIGKRAYVAAGSTVTEDVSDDALAISRSKQREIAGWTKRKIRRRKE